MGRKYPARILGGCLEGQRGSGWDSASFIFFSPPFESSYLFQFSKYICNGLENWEGKVGREQPRSYLNRTLNSEWFINKINNGSRVLGWEISPVFGFYSAAEGNFTVLFSSVPAQLAAGTVQESPGLGTCRAALCHVSVCKSLAVHKRCHIPAAGTVPLEGRYTAARGSP